MLKEFVSFEVCLKYSGILSKLTPGKHTLSLVTPILVIFNLAFILDYLKIYIPNALIVKYLAQLNIS